MNISIKIKQAYSEVDEFLGLLSEELRNEIPKKLRDFFKEEKDKNYFKNINVNIPIKDQNLKEETLAIIALLNLQYWCKNEQEKARLQKIYSDNENKYQEELCNKYNYNDLFKKKEKAVIEENIVSMIEYKKSIITNIINKIKNLLK